MKKIILYFFSAIMMLSAVSCGVIGNEDKFSIYCFRAGAADAFLVKTENSAVLIDTAESDFGDEILDYLSENGIKKLDFLIITHFDSDHVGGAAKILKKISVSNVLQTGYVKDSKKYRNYTAALSFAKKEPVTVTEKYDFETDGVHFTVFPPEKQVYDKDASNNSSLIVSIEYENNSLLFCGDAEDERIAEFVRINNTDYDFIKMPHHGVWDSSLRELLNSTKPEYALITSSVEEPESSKTVELLRDYGIEIFLTRQDAVNISGDGKNIKTEYVK